MVRTVHSSISTEERQQAAEALHASIAVQVEALTESGEWERFLAFAGAFCQRRPNIDPLASSEK